MYQNSSSTGMEFLLIAYMVILPLVIWVYARIARQAGYSGWLALALLVPVLNLVMLCVFAFSTWPVKRRVQILEQQLRSQHDARVREGAGGTYGTLPGGAPHAPYAGAPYGSPPPSGAPAAPAPQAGPPAGS